MQLITTKPMGALGRIGIPVNIRQLHDIKEGTLMDIFIDGNSIIIRPANESGKDICPKCGRMFAGDSLPKLKGEDCQ